MYRFCVCIMLVHTSGIMLYANNTTRPTLGSRQSCLAHIDQVFAGVFARCAGQIWEVWNSGCGCLGPAFVPPFCVLSRIILILRISDTQVSRMP